MNKDRTTYEKVAAHCSEYTPSERCSCSNSVKDREISCINCDHFNKYHHCDLDLIDKITKSHSF